MKHTISQLRFNQSAFCIDTPAALRATGIPDARLPYTSRKQCSMQNGLLFDMSLRYLY